MTTINLIQKQKKIVLHAKDGSVRACMLRESSLTLDLAAMMC